jgi:ATP-dependent helicase/nuclease subunit A
MILAETGYAELLLSQPRGRQRYMNVQQLVRVARQFDDTRGESLYLFLRHIQELQESAGDIEPATISEANAVRLMTVHQSKGLEFPVVAVADMGKPFNTSDQRGSLQLHETYGICATIKAPKTGQRYPSLPLWLARRDSQLNGIGEEMRVLYVALTRAENLLLLFGSASDKQPEKWAGSATARQLFPHQLLRTRCWLDWVATHTCKRWPECLSEGDQSSDTAITVRIHRDAPRPPDPAPATAEPLSSEVERALLDRLSFAYPHMDALREPAKTSVSAVRNRLNEADEEAATPKRFFQLKSARKIDGRDRGVATHTFLQHVDLRGEFTEPALKSQAAAMRAKDLLTAEQLALIDWAAIIAFWESDFGREVRKRSDLVRRELPFTFQLRNEDLAAFTGNEVTSLPEGEFIVTQGVADLVVLAPEETWLIDFKTDSVKPAEVAGKAAEYRAQIDLYALALERIFRKPVSRRGLYFLAAQKLEWIEAN